LRTSATAGVRSLVARNSDSSTSSKVAYVPSIADVLTASLRIAGRARSIGLGRRHAAWSSRATAADALVTAKMVSGLSGMVDGSGAGRNASVSNASPNRLS